MDTQDVVYELIKAERKRQDAKWKSAIHTHEGWDVISHEEGDEISRAILKEDIEQLKIEIIQQAAVLFSWYEAIENGEIIDIPAFVRHIFKCGYGYSEMDMSTDSIDQKLSKAVDLWEKCRLNSRYFLRSLNNE